MMGWSHGGYITLLSVFREKHPFAAGAAIVPVTNLVFRLSLQGTELPVGLLDAEARSRACRSRSATSTSQRSPLYHVDKLQVPLLVHVATNDTDVDYVEDQQIVDALRSRKPDLARNQDVRRIRRPGARASATRFSRRVDPKTLQRVDSPEQIDSWNRTWTFFEWNLRKR